MMQTIIIDVGLLCVCAGLGFGAHSFGYDSLESGQISWSEQQSCNNIILHVYMEGNVSIENKLLEVTTETAWKIYMFYMAQHFYSMVLSTLLEFLV